MRVRRERYFGWIGGARLLVRPSEGRANRNLYCGLEEFTDMAFVLHMLRPEDLFVEVGAGEGAYAVLAGRCCGSPVICVEANPAKAARVRRQVTINQIWHRTAVHEVEAGGEVRVAEVGQQFDPGEAGWDVAALETREMVTLDSLLTGRQPALLRIGIAQSAAAVLAGARRTIGSEALLAVQLKEPDAKIAEELRRHGFERRYYDPMERRLKRAVCGYGASDAIFVRDVVAVEQRLRAAARRDIVGVSV
jgi:FkbM family methyltransferase